VGERKFLKAKTRKDVRIPTILTTIRSPV